MDKCDPCLLGITHRCVLQFLAVKDHRTAVARIYTGQDVHQSGFAGSVLSQKRMYLSLFNGQGDVLQDLNAAEGFIYPAHLQ